MNTTFSGAGVIVVLRVNVPYISAITRQQGTSFNSEVCRVLPSHSLYHGRLLTAV